MKRFWKAHGLGNDYLVWSDGLFSQSNEMTAERVEEICDRHRGLGSDGVLEPKGSARGGIFDCKFGIQMGRESRVVEIRRIHYAGC